MEKLFLQMKEFLSMDSEISFKEFEAYYKELMTFLKEELENLSQEEVLQAVFILGTISSNAAERATRKGPEAKKYKKMAQKAEFWLDALNFRLKGQGMTQEDIEKACEAINEAI